VLGIDERANASLTRPPQGTIPELDGSDGFGGARDETAGPRSRPAGPLSSRAELQAASQAGVLEREQTAACLVL
jgi:hypothetical protein